MLKIFTAYYEELEELEKEYNDFFKYANIENIHYQIERIKRPEYMGDTLLFILFVYYHMGYIS